MFYKLLPLAAALSLTSCAVIIESPHSTNVDTSPAPTETTSPQHSAITQMSHAECEGSVEPPAHLAGYLTASTNDVLLNQALGEPEKGGLCKGQVYEVKKDFTIYRAWNSTNPGSEKGKWWAFNRPEGSVAQYREDYEICYQWSPLDMMTTCNIEAGTQLVIGPGQSAFCSQYLTYPTSTSQQIFITNAGTATSNCHVFQGVFQWQPAN